MKRAYAVIGANYGDEGKGLITDYLASQDPDNTLVLRFNGGAQAGHTVMEYESGRRHVFGHFGAGTMSGAATYLSRNFIVNPLLFRKEWHQLKRLGVSPEISLHGHAPVSTPVDMLINQLLEDSRNEGRHGSCGIGINETVTRSLRSRALNICVEDLADKRLLKAKLKLVRTLWVDLRLQELGLALPEDRREESKQFELISSPESLLEIEEEFLEAADFMLENSEVSYNAPAADTYIYEGAQGLLLNMDRADLFPHVTRSRTGVAVPAAMAASAGYKSLEVIYVTRSYLTRHGAGPLPDEAAFKHQDRTNLENAYQGKLRFAPLDLRTIKHSIELDLDSARFSNIELDAKLALTCLDQQLLDERELPLPLAFKSFGPTRQDVIPSHHRAIAPQLVHMH